MHEILRERVWRRLEALPQEQLYQALDYIEFLEGKYARDRARQPDALQKFAERVEDGLRFRSVAPKVITGTVGLLGTARRVMKTVSDAGMGILGDQPPAASRPPAPPPRQVTGAPAPVAPPASNGTAAPNDSTEENRPPS